MPEVVPGEEAIKAGGLDFEHEIEDSVGSPAGITLTARRTSTKLGTDQNAIKARGARCGGPRSVRADGAHSGVRFARCYVGAFWASAASVSDPALRARAPRTSARATAKTHT